MIVMWRMLLTILCAVCCKVSCRKISDLRVVEGALEGVQLSNSLNRLNEHVEFLVQRVNPFT